MSAGQKSAWSADLETAHVRGVNAATAGLQAPGGEAAPDPE